jgi:hypothetical protein
MFIQELYHSKYPQLKLSIVILFGSGKSYGVYDNKKFNSANYYSYQYEYLGVYTRDELKKKFPNASIRLSNSSTINKKYKTMLATVYRQEKILKILKCDI